MGIFSLFDGSGTANAINKGTQAQVTGIDQSSGLLNQGKTDAAATLSPYTNLGGAAAGAYGDALGLNGTGGTGRAVQAYQESPGYQFQLGQGMQALGNAGAASGSLYSGEAGKALETFGQGLANMDYGQYVDRLGGATQQGQSAANSLNGVNQNYQLGLAGNAVDRGTAIGNGIIGAQGAKQSAFNSILNTLGFGNSQSSGLLGGAGSLFGFL